MNTYASLSYGYDLLDKIWFSDRGQNPRDAIKNLIPNEKCTVLDMCCGTFSNGFSVAKNNPLNRIIGLDRSKEMLREAEHKIQAEGLNNVELVCRDATKTGFQDKCFDYIIMGLVLHECTAELWDSLLGEAHRLLKSDGKLIVLEWDKQSKISRKIKFAPLYAAEVMGNYICFKQFYHCDKKEFFMKYGFQVQEMIPCNYTSVISMCPI